MEEIGKNVYLEDSYAGVVLGLVKLDRSLLLMDSPIRNPDQQSWRAKVAQFGNTINRITLMLDTHIDRTIGLQALGGRILGHENAVEIFARRSSPLRAQDIEPGSESEILNPPVNVRWELPDMTFSQQMAVYSAEFPVTICHRPGSHLAGCWVRLDTQKIIFVGDSVLAYQPPFLAWADLETWLDELVELQSEPLKDYMIVSGRNGLINRKMVERLADFLAYIKSLLSELAAEEEREAAIADLLPGLLRRISFNKKYTDLYRKRLAHGLSRYLKRHDALKPQEK